MEASKISRSLVVLLTCLALTLSGFALERDIANHQDPLETGSQVVWSQPHLEINIGIGASFATTISVQANSAITASISVSPNLADVVTVQPTGSFVFEAGKSNLLNLTFRIPKNTPIEEREGTIQLTANGQDIGDPLEIQLKIRSGFVDPNSNVGLVLPEIGIPMQVILSGDPADPEFDIQAASSADASFVTVASLHLYNNPDRLDLTDWFAKNVDQGGILAAHSTFQPLSAGGGKDALFLTGDVPDGYDGLVQFGYVMSPTRDRVIAISQDQDNQLVDFGVSLEATRAFERQVLENVEFFQ